MWHAEGGAVEVLTKIFVPKGEEITEGWRRFNNVRLVVCTPKHNLVLYNI